MRTTHFIKLGAAVYLETSSITKIVPLPSGGALIHLKNGTTAIANYEPDRIIEMIAEAERED